MRKLKDFIAWLKGKEKVGAILTIDQDCYWEHELTCVKSFKKISKQDLVIAPNLKQLSAHIYKVDVICPPKLTPEDDHNPNLFYVKQFDIIELSKLEQWKQELIKYPYL